MKTKNKDLSTQVYINFTDVWLCGRENEEIIPRS